MKDNKLGLVDLEKARREEKPPARMLEALRGIVKLLEENRLENFAICFDYQDPKQGRIYETVYWDRNNDLRLILGSVEILKARVLTTLFEDE